MGNEQPGNEGRHAVPLAGDIDMRPLFDAAATANLVVCDGRVVDCNTAAVALFGHTREQLLALEPAKLSPEYQPDGSPSATVAEDRFSAALDGRPQRFPWHYRRADGNEFDAEVIVTALGHQEGACLLTIVSDITQSVVSEQQLNFAARILEQTPEGVMITDARYRILMVNKAFEHTTGYGAAEVLGRTPGLLSSGRHDRAFYHSMWAELETHGAWQGEIWNRRKNGDIYPVWLNISVIRNGQGIVSHYVAIFSDITTHEQVVRRLHNLAYYDPLTELPNRELFHDRLSNALIGARREGHRVALLLFDLDRFKSINDTLGHGIGDELLKAAAEKLHSLVRESDTVARLGGDEFTITLTRVRHPGEAANVAAKVLEAFSRPFAVGAHQLYITTSVGIALAPQDGDDVHTLLANADAAMYRAKQAGRNNYQFYDAGTGGRFAERLALENDLREAIAHNALSLVYQPQLNLAGRQVVAAEALLRWHHPRYGTVVPLQIIPIAEETGLILPLGQWVLDEACRQARRWLDAGHRQLRISVNVSASQLRHAGFSAEVRRSLAHTGCPPQHLELELSQSALHENTELLARTLGDLHAMGVTLTLDDFGSNNCSLHQLQTLPLGRLKIDHSFVADAPRNPAVAASSVTIGHNFGMEVTAMGLETSEQLATLQHLGCDVGQGWLLGAPATPSQLAALWR